MANILVENLGTLGDLFTDVATHDPVSAFLMAMSALTMLVAFGVFGVLAIGGVGSLLIPDSIGHTPPRQDR